MAEVTICVDPGVSGGIAVILGSLIVAAFPMPETEEDCARLILEQGRRGTKPKMVIEHVSGFIGSAHPGSRMFTFGESFGLSKGIALGAGWPVEEVSPLVWQNALRLGTNRRLEGAKDKWKRLLKGEAARRYPALKPTLATADAILIAHFVATRKVFQKKF
jgi:hypothetical protein